MDNGDKVYILFGEERFGPFKVDNWMSGGPVALLVNPDGGTFYFDKDYMEPAESEIEERRLYYSYDDDDPDKYSVARVGELLSIVNWDHIEPVYRRWDELDIGDKAAFTEKTFEKALAGEDKYKIAYKLITGEEHP